LGALTGMKGAYDLNVVHHCPLGGEPLLCFFK